MEGLPVEPVKFLKPENLPSVLRSEIRYRDLATGEALFHQGDLATDVYVVVSGRIRLDCYTPEGKFVTFQIVRPHESFAVMALFDKVYEANATGEIPSQVIVYPKQVLLNALANHPELAQELMQQLVKHIYALKIRLELREIRAANDRILHYLKTIAHFSGIVINFERPLKMVALDLGLSPEVFYRALAQLERKGTISRNKRQITLLDLTAA
jgi:CRP-like cAMP-binding protein